MAYIDIKNVTYTYPLVKEPCIKNISITVEKGKFYAIVGANGSGKTTLCNIIRGFIPGFYQGEMQGTIELEGKPLDDYTLGELTSKIGYVFQNPFKQITGARDNVYEEIAYGLENLGVDVETIRKKVEEVMDLTNTAYLTDKNPFELSGGQQQRVAFASVLALEPDIFVIDEPTSQLDPKETERIFDIIDKMKKMGKTIILVEHKIELIAEYADNIIALEDGRVAKCGEKHEVLSDLSLIEKGIDLPQTVLLADELRKMGIPIKEKLITKQEMIWQLKQMMEK
jgi:ABC-type cobalt transport system, ATPase component